MSADLLRRAAAKIRATATLASRELGPDWHGDPGEASDVETHVNLWDPCTARLVARVLDESAWHIATYDGPDAAGFEDEEALARRILGEDE
jgi:hypothetical protein